MRAESERGTCFRVGAVLGADADDTLEIVAMQESADGVGMPDRVTAATIAMPMVSAASGPRLARVRWSQTPRGPGLRGVNWGPPSRKAGAMSSSLEEFEPLDIEVHPERRTVRVVPIGELDLSNVDRVDDQMRELVSSGFHDLVLDLRKLDFIDSSGLRMILQFLDYARDEGTKFAVIHGPPAVEHVFEITGLVDRLPFREAPGSQSDEPARRSTDHRAVVD